MKLKIKFSRVNIFRIFCTIVLISATGILMAPKPTLDAPKTKLAPTEEATIPKKGVIIEPTELAPPPEYVTLTGKVKRLYADTGNLDCYGLFVTDEENKKAVMFKVENADIFSNACRFLAHSHGQNAGDKPKFSDSYFPAQTEIHGEKAGTSKGLPFVKVTRVTLGFPFKTVHGKYPIQTGDIVTKTRRIGALRAYVSKNISCEAQLLTPSYTYRVYPTNPNATDVFELEGMVKQTQEICDTFLAVLAMDHMMVIQGRVDDLNYIIKPTSIKTYDMLGEVSDFNPAY